MESRLDDIQPGWKVVGSDGRELGTVVGTGEGLIRVKTGGLLSSRELTVPADSVEEVETGRVDLSVTRHELEQPK